jgi:predicted PurR-regulated permease PerM
MKAERVQMVYFFVLLIASLVLAGALAYPFLGALTVSVALAISFRPLFRRLINKLPERRGLAAGLTVLIIAICVIVPFSLIGVKIFNEIGDVYANLANDGDLSSRLPGLSNWLNRYAPGINFDLENYANRGIEWLFLNLNDIFSSAIRSLFNLFIIIITLFYLFRDGHRIRQAILRLSPLSDRQDSAILSHLEMTISSVVKGTIVIAIIQGLLAGIGFTFVGLSEPLLWALLATVASILPGFGTGLVFIPVIIYLALTGNFAGAVGLTIWGALVVGLIDNVLRPLLLERDINIHPLPLFLSVLGGLSLFGALGFILGPVILSFAVSLSHIYLEKGSSNN